MTDWCCCSYFQVIKNPMDLGTMEEKVKQKKYKDRFAFEADFRLMISNAKSYNPPGSYAHNLTLGLEKFFNDSAWHVCDFPRHFTDVCVTSSVDTNRQDLGRTRTQRASASACCDADGEDLGWPRQQGSSSTEERNASSVRHSRVRTPDYQAQAWWSEGQWIIGVQSCSLHTCCEARQGDSEDQGQEAECECVSCGCGSCCAFTTSAAACSR